MKVLIGCESSGVIRNEFRKRGHKAFSCDILPADDKSPYHIHGDVRLALYYGWDLFIVHPECTHLCVSGARWFPEKRADGRQQEAIKFFMEMVEANVDKICTEKPVGIMSTLYKKPSQIIQPWQFGHPETKATCLWLKNLPLLIPTDIAEGREHRIHRMAPGPNRSKERSRSYEGIGRAMAEQWG